MIDLIVEDDRWQTVDLAGLAARAEQALFAQLDLAAEWDITLMACDDARIAALNEDFREKPRPTNVLSWPSAERAAAAPGTVPAPPVPDSFGEQFLGDIALAFETCTAEAQAGGLALQDHATHLIVHGILHLLGYDHETEADASLMEGIETRALAALGLADPYMVQ